MQYAPVLAQQSSGGGFGRVFFLLFLAGVGYAVYQAVQASKQETTESRTLKSLPPSIQHVVAKMDSSSQNTFFNEYESKKKKKSVAWIAWFLLGWHYLYLGKVGIQFAYWFTLGGFGVWAFVDLFRVPSIVRSANEQIARNTIQTLGTMSAFGQAAATTELPGPVESE